MHGIVVVYHDLLEMIKRTSEHTQHILYNHALVHGSWTQHETMSKSALASIFPFPSTRPSYPCSRPPALRPILERHRFP
jgi:hypothetical protein